MIKRTKNGFTLVEILVVMVVIGILTAIALPNFIGAEQKARTAGVRSNMRATQLSAEGYGTDTGGVYPPTPTEMAPYYPGGDNKLGGAAGKYAMNPVTGVTNETPQVGGLSTLADITSARGEAPAGFLSKGQLSYDQVDLGASYGVMGSDATGVHVTGSKGRRLVLSNQ